MSHDANIFSVSEVYVGDKTEEAKRNLVQLIQI